MKTISKRNTLSLEKFQIAKLNNLNNIMGGKKGEHEAAEEDETYTIPTNTFPTTIGG